MKTCINCKKEKPLTEYYFRNDNLKFKNSCKDCERGKAKKQRNTPGYKERINKYQRELFRHKRDVFVLGLGGKCNRCGIDDYRVLEIHHKKPENKNWTNRQGGSKRFRDWQKNANDLELLCANCHRIETFEQQGWTTPITISENSLPQIMSKLKRVKNIHLSIDEFPKHLRIREFPKNIKQQTYTL